MVDGSRQVILLGGGGHAMVCRETLLAKRYAIIGYLSPEPTERFKELLPYLGSEAEGAIISFIPQDVTLVNGIGSKVGSKLREEIFESMKNLGYSFLTLIHESAILGSNVEVDEGSQVMAGCVIQPSVLIKRNSIINTRASLDHDTIVGSHVHIGPGATLCGGVQVEDGAYIGAGSTVIQGVHIGRNSVIGAGSVVIRDVAPHTVVTGVPAKERV